MKKILFALSFGINSSVALSNCLCAQSAENHVAFKDLRNFKLSVRSLAALENPALMGTYIPDTKSINARAIRDFQGRYKKVSNAMWFSDPQGGYISYFVRDGYGDRVIYDKKGVWLYSLIVYDENKLPQDIRAMVKSAYYDLAITLVEEIQSIEGVTYIVNLEDKSTIRVVKIDNEGEMKVLQDLSK
jgi:hypothetical protein